MYIKDILSDNSNFVRHQEINGKYNVGCNFLNILQLRQSIPFSWRDILQDGPWYLSETLLEGIFIEALVAPTLYLSVLMEYLWMFVLKYHVHHVVVIET